MREALITMLGLLWISTPAMAQDCLWIDTKEALKYLLNLQKQMDNLLDWPQQKCEEALKKSTQAYTACFCDINSEKIADFRKKLNHVIKDVHPEWQGKKICDKSDEYTSHNVFIGSFESILKRCPGP